MMKSEKPSTLSTDRILLGLFLMMLAMLIIPIRDGIAKYLTDELHVFTIAWGTYVSAALVSLPIALFLHGKEAIRPAGIKSQTARTFLLVASMVCFFFSVRTIPLANAISAYFVGPFVAAALAPFVLKERLSKAVLIAVSCGFFGVLLVLRPDGNFDKNIIFSVIAGVLFAFYMLATRMAARQTPPMAALAFQSSLGVIILTPLAIFSGFDGIISFLSIFVIIGFVQSAAHGLSIAAFRFAPAGMLAPLVYLEIVGAALVGILAFGDWPNTQTWIGISIILAAGALVAIQRDNT